MSSKLAALLTAYQAEHALLSEQLAECLAELDYARARLFQEGIFRVSQQLNTLGRLHDARHGEKQMLTHRIERLQQVLQQKDGELLQQYFAEQLSEAQANLIALQAQPLARCPPVRALREVWRQLAARELSGFTLVLSQPEQLSCQLRLARHTLLLTIAEVRRHRRQLTLEKRHLRQLQRLGFRAYDHGDKLLHFLPFFTAADSAAAQQLLARIAFEVFCPGELSGPASIRYVAPG